MRPRDAVLRIVLPQALIRMLPNLASMAVFAIKDSAIASVIAAPELVRQAQILVGETYRPFEVYTALMVLYFAIAYPLAWALTGLHHRLAARGTS
jgi:polar amino acid transport system permease protein